MKFWFSKSDKGAPAPAPQPAPQSEAAPQPAPQPAPKPEAAPQPAPAEAPTPAQPAPQQPAAQANATPPAGKPAQNQRELYRNLMNSLYDAVLLVDEKGHVVDCNTRVEHTFGYSQNEMWDMPLQQLIKGFGPIVLARLEEPLSEGRPVIISGRGIKYDGSLFEAEICVGKVKLVRSDTLIFTVRDVTKRIQAIQDKARAQAKVAAAPVPRAKVLRCTPKAAAPAKAPAPQA